MTREARPNTSDRRPLEDGLEGVVVAETTLSEVDGERGRLVIAGHDVEELAINHSFEQTACLLWRGAELQAESREGLSRALGRGRERAFKRLSTLGDALRLEDAMDALRATVAQLPHDTSAADIVAAISVFTAAWARLQRAEQPVAPDAERGHAEDIVRMLGIGDDSARARALDAYLVTVSDHGLNASTFAARVVASTRSDRVSALVAAIGALKGPLHGGAPGPVLDMLDAIGTADNAVPYLTGLLAKNERIMGMGHRIYRVRDPRALTLEGALERLSTELRTRADPQVSTLAQESRSQDAEVGERLTLARGVEHAAETLLAARFPERKLRANVEFYTAVLLEAVGVPRKAFSAMFAAGRALGWIAHVAEQRARGRLIRPASRYVGVWPVLAGTPIDAAG